MKSALFGSLALVAMATFVAAGDARAVRSTVAPALLAQAGGIPMPAPLSPIPDPAYSTSQYPPSSYPVAGDSVYAPAQGYSVVGSPVVGQPVELFSDVRYHATRNIAPCAVPTIIQVTDPCNRDRCCKSCVNVQVCVPPCDPACVKVTRDGARVRYDYGKYAVVVKTVGRHVVVHYES